VYLDTAAAEIDGTTTTFTFLVPGHQVWYPRSVIAVASRASGGLPNRAYTLTFATSTGPVAAVGAQDNGTEPGTCVVTWCPCPAASVEAGSEGVSVAPIPSLQLNPGYTIVGAIVESAAGDTWLSATCWYDFAYS